MTVFIILSPGANADIVRPVAEKCGYDVRELAEFTESPDHVLYLLSYRDIEQLACYQGPKIMLEAEEGAMLEYFKQFSDETQAEIELQNFEQMDLQDKVDLRVQEGQISDLEAFLEEHGVSDASAQLLQQVQQELLDCPAGSVGQVEIASQQETNASVPVENAENVENETENEACYQEDELRTPDLPRNDAPSAHFEASPEVQPDALEFAKSSPVMPFAQSEAYPAKPYDMLMVQLAAANKQLAALLSGVPGVPDALARENERLRRANEELLRRLGSYEASRVPESVFAESGRAPSGQGQNQATNTLKSSQIGSPTASHVPIFKSQLSNFQQETQIVKRQILRAERASYTYSNIARPVPLDLVCRVCLEPFQHPVCLPCGHTFCCACLQLAQAYMGAQCAACRRPFQAFPGVDFELQARVQAQCGFDEAVRRGDLVCMLDGRVGRVLEISRAHYDFELRQLSADVRMPLMDVARVETSTGVARSEVFNLTRLAPQYCRVSTRFAANAFLVKTKPPQRLEYGADEYSPLAPKFALLPALSFCTAQAQICALDGFQQGKFRIKDASGNIFEVDTLEDFLALETQQTDPPEDFSRMCVACFRDANLAVRAACGHTFCLSCATRLMRSQLPCLFCGATLSIEQSSASVLITPEIDAKSSFIDNDFLVFCEQKMQFVVQILERGTGRLAVLRDLSGECQVYQLDRIQQIPFDQLVPALRPIAGDIVVQLGRAYKSVAYADGQNIIGAHRRAPMFRAAYLVQNIRLIQRTDLTERMCTQCKQVMRRAVIPACGHRCCRTCALISCVGAIGCFACGQQIIFADCTAQGDREIDIGTIAMKRHSRTNSYGSLHGFVRSIDHKKRQVEIAFASASQKMGENDIVYVPQENLAIKGQPVINQLCIVNSGELKGAYGIAINSMTKEIMLEIGVKVACRDCSMVQVVAERKMQ